MDAPSSPPVLCDLAVSRVLVPNNRALRREVGLLGDYVAARCGRPLSVRFLQDERGEGRPRPQEGVPDRGRPAPPLSSRLLENAPQVFFDAGFPLVADPGLRAAAQETGAFRSYFPEAFGQKRNPLVAPLLDGVPAGFTVSGAIPTVAWVDERLRAGRPLPETWADVLDPIWAGDVTLDNMRFARFNPVCFALQALCGDAGVAALIDGMRVSASNVTSDINMDANETALHITVWPFLRACLGRPYVRAVCPREGAIATPVLTLAKAELDGPGMAALSYFFSPRWAALTTRNGIPSAVLSEPARPSTQGAGFPGKLFWPGWDHVLSFDFPRFNAFVRERIADHPIKGVNV